MKTFSLANYYRKLIRHAEIRRYCSKNGSKEKIDIKKIRNIGILAHIDAGKTTTTERMLFYSGTIRSMGEVHHGNTVTDYMEQERQRGITITSAAVSFPWRDHQINLIDTPGHIDFTMEVEQSLSVLDGAVVVLDGSAGVEAQTLTVWRQSAGYRVPRLIYINKMDRTDADAAACVASVEEKLLVTPLLLHLPVKYEDRLVGLIDLVTLEEIVWTQGRGQKFTRRKLTEKQDGRSWADAIDKHHQLIDKLSGLDDNLANIIIQQDSLDNIKSEDIDRAIRNCTVSMKAFPILCGSSYKNIGVQTLMDAVISYLPTPLQCNDLYKCFDDDLAARVFKVQHDDQRGVLSFLRLYSGEISKGQKIYNLGRNRSEQTGSLYLALADEYKPVDLVTAGNIAVVSALKETNTGDLITVNQASANRAKSRLAAIVQDTSKVEDMASPSVMMRISGMEEPAPDDIVDALLGVGTTIPDPVFLCTIEPPSAASLPALETALAELAREDPSLRVTVDDDAGQLVLGGMGELHLEIIKERIIREYNIDVELGPLQIAYREALVGEGKHTLTVERRIGSVKQSVKITMSAKNYKGVPEDKVLRIDRSPDSAANLSHVHPRQLAAIKQGVDTALLHGPVLSCKMVDVQVTLHWLEVGRGTSDSVLSAAVVQCLRKVFEEASTSLLEPVMSLQVSVNESHASRVVADLARRRASIHHTQLHHGNKVIECTAPLSELLGYSTSLRSLSSGLASFTMQFHCYQHMSPIEQRVAIQRTTGFCD